MAENSMNWRAGAKQIERKSVQVIVSAFEAVPQDGSLLKLNSDGTADLSARVVCSAGTYARTLAEDLGKGLGVGAHLVELRRTRAGHFTINDAITLDGLAELAASGSG